MMLRNEAHLARGRPRRIDQQMGLDRVAIVVGERARQRAAALVLADDADEDAAGAERGDAARDIAGAAEQLLLARDRDHQRRRFRRDPRHLAIDEMVEHQVADAQHRRLAEFRQLLVDRMHDDARVSPVAVRLVEVPADIARHRLLERREAAIVAGAAQLLDIGLREILVAVADRDRHIDILDLRRTAERAQTSRSRDRGSCAPRRCRH